MQVLQVKYLQVNLKEPYLRVDSKEQLDILQNKINLFCRNHDVVSIKFVWDSELVWITYQKKIIKEQ